MNSISIRSSIVYSSIILNLLLVIGSNTMKKKHTPTQECPFCDYPSDKILFQTENVVVFNDRTPKASVHYLICPKEHIISIKTLTQKDIPVLVEMKQVADQLIKEKFSGQEGIVLGFHSPPFYSVKHLHLHLLVPPFRPKFKKHSYTSHFGGIWFKDFSVVLNELYNSVV
ncbi:hypothetical protein RB653_003969 [Dictyostelium firmibasis]|uniref:HIT domain-containing protein n=1 Tax=Dictyostelium firmibasis TaxID=79012 RepID=A0AAN7U6L6_9MYCE